MAGASAGKPGFSLLSSAATGIAFTNRLSSDRYTTNQIYLNGSGVAAGDIDDDGLCDLLFCGLSGSSTLYRNVGGFRFADVTRAAGLALDLLDCSGAAFADLDGDGRVDLALNTYGQGTRIFLNDGQGHFRLAAMLNEGRCGSSLALADMDGDGDLDLYIANYRMNTFRDAPGTRFHVNLVDGEPVITQVNDRPVTEPDLQGRFRLDPRGRILEFGEADVLYRNDGGGRWTPVPWTGGAFLGEDGQPLKEPPYDWGLSVTFRDLNGDGLPDLYVCNDFHTPDRLWLNQGEGRFRLVSALALRSTSIFSMGVDVADVNRDGADDLFVSDMYSRFHALRMVQVGDVMPTFLEIGRIDDRPQYSRNTLSLNRGDGTYAEIGQYAGLEASEWTWCPVFLDVDLDGYEDLLVTSGHVRDSMNADVAARIQATKQARQLSPRQQVELNRLYPPLPTGCVAFRNRGDLTFAEASKEWGYDAPGVFQGQGLADLDNDGDLDVVVSSLNGGALVYRNDAAAPRVGVRLRGLPPNTGGIGARVQVTGGPVPQSQEIMAGGRYLSSDQPMRTFAAGASTNLLRIEVTWRSGRRSTMESVPANCVCVIDEASALAQPSATPSVPKPWFEKTAAQPAFSHHDENFDDFARQPLLPRRLSQLGPGVAWHDLNGDGWDDLIVGTGRGGTLAVFFNDTRGGWQRQEGGSLERRADRDLTAILGRTRADGTAGLLMGVANYEDGRTNGAMVYGGDLRSPNLIPVLPATESSAGPLAMVDYDGDGELDLFVGGRCMGGRYPEPASSWLMRGKGAGWELDRTNSQALRGAGLVSGAVWTDLDGDGWPDLVCACEWGPVRVFRNDRGRMVEQTRQWGLEQLTGWWTSVASGDFDGDGRPDLIVGNWGRNSRYRATAGHPRRLYYGDLDGDGTVDLLEAVFDPVSGKEVPDRGYRAASAALPFLVERFPTYAAYAAASIQDVLGDRAGQMRVVEANTLESMVFLNRGGRFDAAALPAEAQFAPAFGVCVADFDGDGCEDVFLAQNFFAVSPDAWRCDAGRGLLLLGDGKGSFKAVPGQASGLKVYGEQRGAAVADFDRDGRADLAVAQNGAALKLYRNRGAQPGLRVRLRGPAPNPTGVGASLQVLGKRGAGPVREVQAGSGYWSQNSAVQVLARPEGAKALRVRWPGGQVTTKALGGEPPGADMEVRAEPAQR